MPASLFDTILIVDWSAASVPARGRDSIWIAEAPVARPTAVIRANADTRLAACRMLDGRIARARAAGERLLLGFDFPFGYPAGSAAVMAPRARIGDGGGSGEGDSDRAAGHAAPWAAVWALLGREIVEGARNANNRFALAARLNARFATASGTGPGPFWGRPARLDLEGLPVRKPAGYGTVWPAEFRAVEHVLRAETGRRPSACWQLFYNPTVGGQALTGIAALERLRHATPAAPGLRLWPFETGLAAPVARPGEAVLAEVYPSLIHRAIRAAERPGEVRDAAQVRVLATAFARLDRAGTLGPLFAGAPGLDAGTRRLIETEEAWVLGAGHAATLSDAAA